MKKNTMWDDSFVELVERFKHHIAIGAAFVVATSFVDYATARYRYDPDDFWKFLLAISTVYLAVYLYRERLTRN